MSTENTLGDIAKTMFATPAPAQPAPVAQEQPVPEVTAEALVETPAVEEVPAAEVAETPAVDSGDEQDEEVEVPVTEDANKSILAHLAGQPQSTVKVHKRVVDYATAKGIPIEVIANYSQYKEANEKRDAELKAAKEELAIYAQAPPEFKHNLALAVQGDVSWKKNLVGNGLDFDYTKEADKQPKKALVDAFLPGKVTEDQWKEFNDAEGDARDKAFVSTMIELASEKFAGKAKEVNGAIEQMAQAQQQWESNWKNSGEAAWNATKQRMPGATIYEQQLRQVMSSPNGIMSLFEEPGKPGVLRQDAYENVMMAIPEIRQKVLGGQAGNQVKAAKDAAELKVIKRSPDKPAPVSTPAAKMPVPQAAPNLQEMAKRLIGIT